MNENSVFALIGLVAQLFIFILIFSSISRYRDKQTSFIYGLVVSIVGYSIFIAVLSLLTISWKFSNVFLLLFSITCCLKREIFASVVSSIISILKFAKIHFISTAVLIVLLVFHFAINILKPVVDIDGQLYHGPVLAQILTSGSLWNWKLPTQYMAYTDLTMAGNVNLSTLFGTSILVDAAQVPYLLLLTISLIWILHKRFNSYFISTSLSVLIVSSPVIWLQPRILYVDLAYGAVIAVAIFLFSTISLPKGIDFLIFGIITAGVFGTKPAGLVAGSILILLFISKIFIRSTTFGLRNALLSSLALFFTASLGLVFYIRNLVEYGNPIYPVSLRLGEIKLPGLVSVETVAQDSTSKGFFDFSRIVSYFESITVGASSGIEKLDYDPRVGGFGHIPLIVISICGLILLIQLITLLKFKIRNDKITNLFRIQILALSTSLLLIFFQPSAGDSRYVIGQTSVILSSILLTTFGVQVPKIVINIIAISSLMISTAQVRWTETNMYPGINFLNQSEQITNALSRKISIKDLNSTVAEFNSDNCQNIALETNGGVNSGGMAGGARFATLSYPLYGSKLCNTVTPFVAENIHSAETTEMLRSSDLIVAYQRNSDQIIHAVSKTSNCLAPLLAVPADSSYPEAEIIYKNTCVH